VGLALLAVLLVSLARLLWRMRATAAGAVWAGVVAATAAFAVHSGFDFVWHLPAVVLTVCLLAGLMLPMPRRRRAAHAALEAPGLAVHPMAWASTRGEHQEHATSSGGPVPRGSGGTSVAPPWPRTTALASRYCGWKVPVSA
jgi:glucose dehydrogenase